MGVVVIACYRPKPGREGALVAEARQHWATLRGENLVTERPPIVAQAIDGTVVEVFEWNSAQAMEDAHGNPVVQRMWRRYGELCEYVPIADVPEAEQLFSPFTPLPEA